MMKNADGQLSVKKVIGVTASICFFGGCIYQIVTGTADIINMVLDKLSNFALFALGLKVVSGAIAAGASVAEKKVTKTVNTTAKNKEEEKE